MLYDHHHPHHPEGVFVRQSINADAKEWSWSDNKPVLHHESFKLKHFKRMRKVSLFSMSCICCCCCCYLFAFHLLLFLLLFWLWDSVAIYLFNKNAFFSSLIALLECKHDVARDLHFSLCHRKWDSNMHTHSQMNGRNNKKISTHTQKGMNLHRMENKRKEDKDTQNAMTQMEYSTTTMAIQWHREMEYVVFLFCSLLLLLFFCVCAK